MKKIVLSIICILTFNGLLFAEEKKIPTRLERHWTYQDYYAQGYEKGFYDGTSTRRAKAEYKPESMVKHPFNKVLEQKAQAAIESEFVTSPAEPYWQKGFSDGFLAGFSDGYYNKPIKKVFSWRDDDPEQQRKELEEKVKNEK